MNNNKINIILASGLILMVGAARIVNHEMQFFNYAPVCALGLFAGAIIKDKRIAYLLPILAQLTGDLYFQLFTKWPGFYGVDQVCVYAALILVTMLGSGMGQPKAVKVLGYTLAGATVFFLLSNFGVWLAIEMGGTDILHYGKGFPGLVNTFAAGIPFFKNTLAGEYTGSILLFGAYYLLQVAMLSKAQKATA